MGYYEELVDKMTTYYCNQTKCTPDQASDVMIRIRVLADQLAEHCKTAEAAVQNAFPLTAEGEAFKAVPFAQGGGSVRGGGYVTSL